MTGLLGGAAGREEQYLIDQGIIRNRTMGGGILRPAILCGTNSTFRAGYIGLNSV